MATRVKKAEKVAASDIFITEGDKTGEIALCWANSTILGVIHKATDGAGWMIRWVRQDDPAKDAQRTYEPPEHPDKFYNSRTEACVNVAKQSGALT